MKLISSENLIKILECTLDHVDNRLTGHARGVGFIIYTILKNMESISFKKLQNLYLIGLLHDIGAYKTEEIDDLISFDANHVWHHSVYGSLFLKTLTPLSKDADILLYHHLDYCNYNLVSPSLPENHFAGLICLADRIELQLRNLTEKQTLNYIESELGKKFSPYWVNEFIKANNATGFMKKIKNGNFSDDYQEMLATFKFTKQEKEQFLEVIAYSIDFRSSFMVKHTVSTVSVSRLVSQQMNHSEKELYQITYGALLHDIGKVAIPVSILEKPGVLTSEEMKIMRDHVILSREILEKFLSPEICEIACRHHEKIDGTGYPQGLTGSQLSLCERIVAVADVVSALIRSRSYKEAYNSEKTTGILKAMSKSGHLCPEVVDVVLANFENIIKQSEIDCEKIFVAYNFIQTEYNRMMSEINDYYVKEGKQAIRKWEK